MRLIAGFDHVVIAVRDLDIAADAYGVLLGRAEPACSVEDGVAKAVFVTANLKVEVLAPVGETDRARRLSVAIDDGGEGLKSLVFATHDLAGAHRRLERVGLDPEPISGASFRLSTERTHGVRTFLTKAENRDRPAPLAGALTGLDHVVIRTQSGERAAALYGARLGLDMRLDREVMGRRLLFFRCGDAVVEIVEDTTVPDGRDRLWGLSWRTNDIETTHERLATAGLDVSEVRPGLKPETRVFTVRNGTCGVPTLILENLRARS